MDSGDRGTSESADENCFDAASVAMISGSRSRNAGFPAQAWSNAPARSAAGSASNRAITDSSELEGVTGDAGSGRERSGTGEARQGFDRTQWWKTRGLIFWSVSG